MKLNYGKYKYFAKLFSWLGMPSFSPCIGVSCALCRSSYTQSTRLVSMYHRGSTKRQRTLRNTSSTKCSSRAITKNPPFLMVHMRLPDISLLLTCRFAINSISNLVQNVEYFQNAKIIAVQLFINYFQIIALYHME